MHWDAICPTFRSRAPQAGWKGLAPDDLPPPPPPHNLGQPQHEEHFVRTAAGRLLRRASAFRSRLALFAALLALLSAGLVALHSAPAQAQTGFTVDVRIGVKPLENGAYEFSLILDNEHVLPEHRYLTATKATLERWNRSSTIVRSVTDPADPGNSETLTLAIDVGLDSMGLDSNGRLEMALLNGAQRVRPSARFIPMNIPIDRIGRWLRSSAVQISLPQATVPGGTMIPSAVQMSTGPESVEAHLSVPGSDGTDEPGFPWRNPHFYQAGASALTLNVHVGEVVDAAHGQNVRRCNAGVTDSGCVTPTTFNSDWNAVRVGISAWDDSSSSWTSTAPSLGVTLSVPTISLTCSNFNSANCTISRSDWMSQQSNAIASSEVAPLTVVLNTSSGVTTPLRIEAFVDFTGLGDGSGGFGVWRPEIVAMPDLTPTPKLFFFNTSSLGYTRPCSDAQMAAEAEDDCDPVVPDGNAVRIGFTVLNGASADHTGWWSTLDRGPSRFLHQRSFNDFDRIELTSDGPGSFHYAGTGSCQTFGGTSGTGFVGVPATQTEAARVHGSCTISSTSTSSGFSWYYYASTRGLDAAPDRALSQAETVGHGAVLFRPWPTGGTRDYTITAKLYRKPRNADPAETPVTATIVVEDVSVASLLQPSILESADVPVLFFQRGNKCVSGLLGRICYPTAAAPLFSDFADSGPMVVLRAQPGLVSVEPPFLISGGGTLYVPTNVACDEQEPRTCTTSITKDQLKQGVFAPSAMGDTWPIAGSSVTNGLYLHYTAPLDADGPAIVSARLIDKAGTSRNDAAQYEFSRVATPVVEARISEDADGTLEPGQTTALRVGFRVEIDQPSLSDPTAQTIFATDVGSFVWHILAGDVFPIFLARDNLQDVELRLDPASYLVLAGGATWASDGSTRLQPEGLFRCDYDEAASNGSAVFFCWLQQRQADGTLAAPQITVADDADGDIQVTANFVAAEGEKFLINYRRERPAGWTDATWRRWNYRRTHDAGDSYFGAMTLPVGEKARLESVSLQRANEASGTIRAKGSAVVELALRDQNGNPAAIGTVSSITVTATAGTLGGAYCDGGSACSITLAEGSAFRAAVAENPALAAKIPITFTAPDESGTSSISATVVDVEGGRPATESIEIAYSSSASAIMLGSEMARVLAWGTPDADDPATADVNEKDDRDVAEISVASLDRQGRAAELPRTISARLIDPNGDEVGSGATLTTACATVGGVEDRSDCKFVIDVNADRASPLASGLYTLRASFGGETHEATFTVAGAPAAITADPVPDLPALGETFSWGVAVADETGAPAADGTSVRFSTQAAGTGTEPLLVVSPAGGAAKSKNGRAEATFTVIGWGVGIIRIAAGSDETGEPARQTVVVDAGQQAAEPAVQMLGLPPAESASDGDEQPAASGLASFSGSSATSASNLLSTLEGRRSIHVWNGRRWIRYAVSEDGSAVPGSIDFTLVPGDFVWLGE